MNGCLTVLSVQFQNMKFSEYKSNMQIFRVVTEKENIVTTEFYIPNKYELHRAIKVFPQCSSVVERESSC